MSDLPFDQRAHAMFEAIDAGRFDALPNYYTEDCRYSRPGFDVVEGIDALLHFYREVRIISSGRHVLDTIVASDGCAAIAGTFSGVLRDGTQCSVRFSDVYRLAADQRISDRRTYFFVPGI